MWRLLDQGVIQPQSVTLTKIANAPHSRNKQHQDATIYTKKIKNQIFFQPQSVTLTKITNAPRINNTNATIYTHKK